MITIEQDDYILVRHKTKKPVLCLVLNGKTGRAVIEHTLRSDEPEYVQVEPEKIVANLGQEPEHGKVFGVDVEPYINTIETRSFGPVMLFRKVDNKELKALKRAMQYVRDQFKEQANADFLPVFQIHVLPNKGKYAGSYTVKTSGGQPYDIIKFHPEVLNDETFNQYLVAHEFAHGLWFRSVPDRLKTKWINLYQKRLKLSSIEEKHLLQLCNDLVRYESGIQDFSKEISDDKEKLILREVISYFRKHHSLAREDVDLMLQNDSGKLADIWPTKTVLTETRPDISKYSLKNVKEFFAEAVAYHFSGYQLPKDVQKGLDQTFAKCRQL